jgi:hypothetical protein
MKELKGEELKQRNGEEGLGDWGTRRLGECPDERVKRRRIETEKRRRKTRGLGDLETGGVP